MNIGNVFMIVPYHAVHIDLIPSRTEISSLGQSADLPQELSRPLCHLLVGKSQLSCWRLVRKVFEWR